MSRPLLQETRPDLRSESLHPSSNGHPAEGKDRTRLPTRVSDACERCRRHKSRCDRFRPCSLCQRANVQCLQVATRTGGRQRKSRVQVSQSEQAGQLSHETLAQTRTSGNVTRENNVAVPSSTGKDGSNSANDLLTMPSFVDYRETESTMGIARKIFQLGSQNLANLTTSAIPDGEIPSNVSNSAQTTSCRLPIVTVLGHSLPRVEAMLVLLEAYFDLVHWFSLVIYEPTFRTQFDSICDGYASPSQKSFLLLLSTVLGVAAWYCSKWTSPDLSESVVDWSDWASKLLKFVESQLFHIIDQSSLATIQTCTLLASYHSYHGKPKAAFGLLGATIKTAQAMGLHRECLREAVEISEEKKRIWWTIYTWDRWASITYGRPLGINEKDCNVSMPADIYENRRFKAIVTDEINTLVCYSAYQRELNKLYVIASPMIETIFGIRSSFRSGNQTPKNLYADLMQDTTRRLNDWRQRLPQHLTFDFDNDIAPDASAIIKAHRLQALALQLTFDHLVIVFNRPFISQQVFGLSQSNRGASISSNGESPTLRQEARIDNTSGLPNNRQLPSSEQWLSAAVRTSRVTQLPHVAHLATNGHLVAFLAINLFNSAVVLVVCALSDPLSDRAQEAKRNVTRISRLQELLGKQSQLSLQSSFVLRDMILMIVQREAEAMLASISPMKDPNGNDVDVQISPSFSVGDALRLPLSAQTDHTSRVQSTGRIQENYTILSDEASRWNESLASLQRVFPGNAASSVRLGYENRNEQIVPTFGGSLNPETWYNSFQQHNLSSFGRRPFDDDGNGDGLYWIWNSMDGSSADFL